MKNRTRMIALVLAILMVLGLAACAAQTAEPTPQDTPAEQPEETVSEQPQEEPPAEEPAEEPEEAPAEEAPAEEPEQAPTETVFPEAMEVLSWLNGLDEAGTQHPDSALTGAQAQLMLSAVGKTDSGLDTAESVSAGTFLAAALELLGQLPGESVMDSARLARLLPGLTLDEAADITVEQAAQVVRNALVRSSSLQAAVGLTYTVLPDYPNGYNAVSGSWSVTASGEAVTQPMVAAPVAVFGRAITWCDVLTYLGYTIEEYNPMVTLQNSFTGGEFTVKYEKCHWDADGTGPHSGCSNAENWTNELNATMEMYQISENEYRNIYKINFLGSIVDGSLTLYGYNNETWGPWGIDTLPETGYYIVNYYWNAYGAGEGLDVVQPAETMVGTLDSINDTTVVIDGQEYTLSYVFNYGSMMAKAPTSAGKQFTWFLDQNGLIVGCGEYFGAS